MQLKWKKREVEFRILPEGEDHMSDACTFKGLSLLGSENKTDKNH